MSTQLPCKGDHVGSLLRTNAIKKAREKFDSGTITSEQLKEVEDQEIEKIVKQQIDVGLKAITDGEFRRAWWQFDYYFGLTGFKKIEKDTGFIFDGDETKAETVEVNGKIKWEGHEFIEHFKYLKELVEKHGDGSQVAKMTIPAPFVSIYREISQTEKELYPTAEAFFKDLGKSYKDALHAFYEAGCRYIQFDDTILAALTDEEFVREIEEKCYGLPIDEVYDLVVQTTQEIFKDKPEDLIVSTHLCKGNFRSTFIHDAGDYDYVARRFDELGYDAYFLEYDTERAGGFEPLQHIKNKDTEVVLGLITSKTGPLEDKTAIEKRIGEAASYLRIEQLALSPQCGFASTEDGNKITEEDQWNKLTHVVDIAKTVWHS